MTCFWDGLLAGLTKEDFTTFHLKHKPNVKAFIQLLQKSAVRTTHVVCNGTQPTEQQLTENLEAVREFNINTIHGGYDCSTFDPFLFLVAELFNLNITHTYLKKHVIQYNNTHHEKRKLRFMSDRGHFWKI
tara:strand:+ start:58 stop:450 length:393 start_codon:yes stop_codon:yes gene_type:complete